MPPQRKMIYEYIQANPFSSRNDIDNAFPNIKTGVVSARVNELIKSKFIEVEGVKWDDDTKRNVQTLRVTKRDPEQLSFIQP